MIIGIDGNEANVVRRVGISEFAYELMNGFYEQDKETEFVIYLKKPPLDHLPKERKNWKYKVVGPAKLWTQIGLPLDLYLKRPRPDVFFSPTHYAPRFSPSKTVVSIMDLSYIHFPEYFKKNDLYQLKSWTAYSVKNAVKIITISESSKDDIIKYYRVSDNVVTVVYPGIKSDLGTNLLKNMDDKYTITNDFILFVGTLQPRKNIERLIEAFSEIKPDYPKLDLLIVGKKGWLYEEILSAPVKYHVNDSVKFLDYVSDESLPSFYKNALCFVLPSLYEGFGLPILEAMKYECPVVTSNVSSLPEVGGDAALYFDPENAHDIAVKIEKVISDKQLRDKMKKKGLEQVKKFSWEKAAEKTLAILKEVGNA